MRTRLLIFALLFWIGAVSADLKDFELSDESIRKQKFEESQRLAHEIIRKREERKLEFIEKASIATKMDSCLAYESISNTCLISTNHFNKRLASYFPNSFELLPNDSITLLTNKARSRVFEELIDGVFLENMQFNQFDHFKKYLVKHEYDESRQVINPSLLPLFIKANAHFSVQVLAASDSAWLSTALKTYNNGIQPVTISAWNLPDSIIIALSSIQPGQWTPVFKVGFGYLTCSWINPIATGNNVEEINYFLSRFTHHDNNRVKVDAELVLNQYRKYCVEEDTLDLFVKLRPPVSSKVTVSEPNGLLLKSTALPEPIKTEVWRRFVKSSSDTLTSIRGMYGRWFISRVSNSIRSGNFLDSTACLNKANLNISRERQLEELRAEWQRFCSKKESNKKIRNKTFLLEQLNLSDLTDPESTYLELRNEWVLRSVRFTQDISSLVEIR